MIFWHCVDEGQPEIFTSGFMLCHDFIMKSLKKKFWSKSRKELPIVWYIIRCDNIREVYGSCMHVQYRELFISGAIKNLNRLRILNLKLLTSTYILLIYSIERWCLNRCNSCPCYAVVAWRPKKSGVKILHDMNILHKATVWTCGLYKLSAKQMLYICFTRA